MKNEMQIPENIGETEMEKLPPSSDFGATSPASLDFEAAGSPSSEFGVTNSPSSDFGATSPGSPNSGVVKAGRQDAGERSLSGLMRDAEPWPEPVDGAELMDELARV